MQQVYACDADTVASRRVWRRTTKVCSCRSQVGSSSMIHTFQLQALVLTFVLTAGELGRST